LKENRPIAPGNKPAPKPAIEPTTTKAGRIQTSSDNPGVKTVPTKPTANTSRSTADTSGLRNRSHR
jgi:hypothetical protein